MEAPCFAALRRRDLLLQTDRRVRLPAPPALDRSAWIGIWVKTAAFGTALLVVYFASYEILERFYLLEHFSPQAISYFHMGRGLTASILVGTLAFVTTSLTRRRYDEAFASAYRDLEDAYQERTRTLERTQGFSELVFEALRDRLILIDENGRIVKANRVAREALGTAHPEGMPCSLLGAACSPCTTDCVADRARAKGLPIVNESLRTDPRTGRVYEVDSYPVPDPEGRRSLVLEAARDVTDEKQLEAQLRYQERLAALGVLAAGIAHDIGNPLASISSELELLEGETDPEVVRGSVAVVRSQLARMSRVLREMTDFARRRGEEAGPVSVEEAVGDALRMIRHDPRARRVHVETELEPALPRLWMVEDHLVMVLVNLAINALDAMPDGGHLTMRAASRDGGVRIEVRDDGVGMSEEVRRRATEPMFTTKPGRGTGLGLAVSADILRSLGGAVVIDSAPGRGTTVRLDFPEGALAAGEGRRAAHA